MYSGRCHGAEIVGKLFGRVGGAPAAGEPWMLVVGDSISFGLSADPDRVGRNDSWAAQIAPMLAATQRPWTVDDAARRDGRSASDVLPTLRRDLGTILVSRRSAAAVTPPAR